MRFFSAQASFRRLFDSFQVEDAGKRRRDLRDRKTTAGVVADYR